MKKIALFAAVSSFALALAACGGSDDASEDALADNVELPADEAMADAPMPAMGNLPGVVPTYTFRPYWSATASSNRTAAAETYQSHQGAEGFTRRP